MRQTLARLEQIYREYLWRVLDQSRNRPQFIIDKVYD